MRRIVNIWEGLDWITVMLYLSLVIMGWLNIYAAVYSDTHHSILDIDMRYGKQLIWIMAALIMALTIMFIDTRFFSFFAFIIYVFGLLTLFAVAILGKEVNGARSWFDIAGVHIQPTEFAKVATCLAVAKYLSSFGVKIEKLKTIIIVGILIFLPAALIMLQPDFGSVIVYAALIFVLYREGFPGGFLFFGFLLVALFVMALVLSKPVIIIILVVIALLSLIVLNRRYLESVISAIFIVSIYFIIFGIKKFSGINFML